MFICRWTQFGIPIQFYNTTNNKFRIGDENVSYTDAIAVIENEVKRFEDWPTDQCKKLFM